MPGSDADLVQGPPDAFPERALHAFPVAAGGELHGLLDLVGSADFRSAEIGRHQLQRAIALTRRVLALRWRVEFVVAQVVDRAGLASSMKLAMRVKSIGPSANRVQKLPASGRRISSL